MSWVEREEIARGATAVVTRGEPGTVVKTLNAGLPRIVVELEAAGNRAALAAGLPCAALLAADIDATPPTLTFAFVDGEPLAHRIDRVGPEQVGRILAELQHRIRAVLAPQVIPIEDFLGFQLAQAPIPAALRAAAQRDLARLTAHAARVLCHMDFHDMNVLWVGGDGGGRDAGKAVIIDWMNASAAPPEADVARTRMLLAHEKYYAPEAESHMARLAAAFVERTERLVPGLVGASREWDRVIAAARLDERPPEAEREAILARFAR